MLFLDQLVENELKPDCIGCPCSEQCRVAPQQSKRPACTSASLDAGGASSAVSPCARDTEPGSSEEAGLYLRAALPSNQELTWARHVRSHLQPSLPWGQLGSRAGCSRGEGKSHPWMVTLVRAL